MRLPNLESKRKKNSLWIKFFERNQILKQVYNNATDLGSRVSQYVRILANFTQLVLFWMGIFLACLILNHLFTVRQILNRNFNNLTDFHVKLFWKINFCWTVRYQKIFFLSFYTVKMSKLALSHFVGKFVSESDVFGKKIIFWIENFENSQNLNQLFHNCSNWESKILKRVDFGTEFLHGAGIRIKVLTFIRFWWKNCF